MTTLPTDEPGCVDPADARAIDLVIPWPELHRS
jgi:hypothetical protein